MTLASKGKRVGWKRVSWISSQPSLILEDPRPECKKEEQTFEIVNVDFYAKLSNFSFSGVTENDNNKLEN
jgi:hypothetical protein